MHEKWITIFIVEDKLDKQNLNQLRWHLIGGDKIMEKREKHKVDGTVRSFEAKH
jgi:hypothetical protein